MAAWVRASGTTVNASYNVSSITNLSTAQYRLNFTSALVDTNYCAVVNSGDGSNYDVFGRVGAPGTSYATGSFTFINSNNGGGQVAASTINAVIFR
jgi:hypothetical protein